MALSREELTEIAKKVQAGSATPEELLRLSQEVNGLLEQLNDALRDE